MIEPNNELNITPRPLLEETFYTPKNELKVTVKLTEKGVSLYKASQRASTHVEINASDIVGFKIYRMKLKSDNCCPCEDVGNTGKNDNSVYLWIVSFLLKESKRKCKLKRERVTITLKFCSYDEFTDNLKEAKKWQSLIYRIKRKTNLSSLNMSNISDVVGKGQKLLVVVNPRSGAGRGRDLFLSRVAPLLLEADVSHSLHVTAHAGDARSLARSMDLNIFGGGVVCMGGDGIIFEVINGILERRDWKTALQILKLGIIPCGSGNGLAKSICYEIKEPYDSDPLLVSALNVIQGDTRRIDVARVQTTSKVMFSLLSVGWGVISDIDIESERLRALGGQRFAVWMILRVIGLRTYPAKLSYLRAKNVESDDEYDSNYQQKPSCIKHEQTAKSRSLKESNITLVNEDGNAIITNENVDTPIKKGNLSHYGSYDNTISIENVAEYSCQDEDHPQTKTSHGPTSSLPDLSEPLSDEWTVCQGDFVMVHATYKSHFAEDCLMAPRSLLDDKIIWLCIIKAGISKRQLVRFLLGLSSGSHTSVPNTELVPVTAFRLEPQGTDSYLTVDGERVPTGPLQVEMIPYTIQVLARSQ